MTGKYGSFINPSLSKSLNDGGGYTLKYLRKDKTFIFFRKKIYDFQITQLTPLTWHDRNGYWRADTKTSETDLGSIPIIFQGMLPANEFPASYCMHDRACRLGGLYWSSSYDGPYQFKKLSRHESDCLLFYWVDTEGKGTFDKYPIWIGVTIAAYLNIKADDPVKVPMSISSI